LAIADGDAARRLPERVRPTRWGALLFRLKTNLLRLARFVREFGRRPAKLPRGGPAAFVTIVAESRTPLWSDPQPAEQALQRGKVQNLRTAARRLDGTLLPKGAVFSFWRQLGRASAWRGFVAGRMLQEGCLVPAIGGGLCQLSNALYDVALQAGCPIVEQHSHSRVVPESQAARGRDATVAWNYVDLRFQALATLMLRVSVERDALLVQLLSPQRERADAPAAQAKFVPRTGAASEARSCATCGETTCFRHEGHHDAPRGCRAFLVDENWPEFRDYVVRNRKAGDVLALPLDGQRWNVARYAWPTEHFARVTPATLTALRRSLALRLAADGPARRVAALRRAKALAKRLARALTPDVTEVVVAQSLLPWLWRDGQLGGRRISVLMTRLPMLEIQARLDAAAARHPQRKTLADFRADPALVAAESAALAAADTVVTPHAEVAALLGDRALLLDWSRPKAQARVHAGIAKRIAFVGPTLARKGAYELRAAAKALNLEVVLTGSELEGPGFWDGVRTRRATADSWLDGVAAVVQPALLEDVPRRLLAALSAGVPVIATRACGLAEQRGLTLVPEDDVDALVTALRGT
jgi:hypothetical protein